MMKDLLKEAYQTIPMVYRELASMITEYQRLLAELNKLEIRCLKASTPKFEVPSLDYISIR